MKGERNKNRVTLLSTGRSHGHARCAATPFDRARGPNDAPLEYDGVYVKLVVLDKTFATAVSDARGSVPRCGEAIVAVPVTVSVQHMARHAIGMLDGSRSSTSSRAS